ncbi:MAG TPA: hypothetical protein DCG39_03515, partial [Opitutae bacterium]|nr:hypothetical protein [Opitutae bacterium]
MLELLDWRLTWDLADAVIALAVLGLSVYLSRKTWLRSGKKNSVLALECLRFLTVFMILATLLNPEQVEQLDKKGEPEIVCLLDVSGSMSTLDVIDSNGSVESRIDWARKSLDSDWKRKLEQNSTVTVRNFSSQSGTQATNLSMALGDTLEGTGNLKAVLFLSDGDSNDGPSILSLAGKCRSSGVPVYSIRVGSPKPLPDLALEDAFAPSFALQEEKITINYRISNAFDTRQKSSLKLMANEQVVSQKPVLLPASEEIAGSIAWLPPGEGDYELKLTLDQVPGESLPG